MDFAPLPQSTLDPRAGDVPRSEVVRPSPCHAGAKRQKSPATDVHNSMSRSPSPFYLGIVQNEVRGSKSEDGKTSQRDSGRQIMWLVAKGELSEQQQQHTIRLKVGPVHDQQDWKLKRHVVDLVFSDKASPPCLDARQAREVRHLASLMIDKDNISCLDRRELLVEDSVKDIGTYWEVEFDIKMEYTYLDEKHFVGIYLLKAGETHWGKTPSILTTSEDGEIK